MEIITLNDNELNTNTYLVKNDNFAVVIDPCSSVKDIETALDKSILSAIFLTHAHFDHFLSLNDLMQKYPSTKVYMDENAVKKLSNPFLNASNSFGTNISYQINPNSKP